MNLALSERLLNVETGIKKQTYEEHIIRLGGTAGEFQILKIAFIVFPCNITFIMCSTLFTVPHVGTFMCNTILICTKEDFKRKTLRVRDALNSKVKTLTLPNIKSICFFLNVYQ